MKKTFRAASMALAFLALVGTAAAQVDTNIAYAKRDDDHNFYPDDPFTTYLVRGRVTSLSFATNRAEFFIQDTNDNIGIQVIGEGFTLDTNSYHLGYEVSAEGLISQTNGLRSINPTFEFLLNVTDATEINPAPVVDTITNLLAVAESNESRLVEIDNVNIVSGSWPDYGSSATLTITDNTGQIALRIDADVDLDGQLPPTNTFSLRGIFSQFDTSTNANSGYQILPRSYADILTGGGNQPPAITILHSNSIFSVDANAALIINILGLDLNSGDTLALSAPVKPAGATFTDYGSRQGQFAWTPSDGDRGTTNQVTFEVTDGTLTSSVSVLVYVLTEEQANIVLNEVHWDPAPGAAGDANGDGTRDAVADEFVEIVNNNAFDVDFSGYHLLFDTNALHEFLPGTILTSKTAVVVFGPGQTPVGQFGNAQVFVSTNWAGLANTPGDRNVILQDSNGTQIFSYNYGDFGQPDQSATRSPDITGGYVLHLTANPNRRWSPGTRASGAGFEGSGLTNTAPSVSAINDTFVQLGSVRTISISAIDVEGNDITLTVSNAPATAKLIDNADGTGLFIYTGVVADAGTSFNVEIYASDGSASSSEPFLLSVAPQEYSGLLINEYLADPDAADGSYVDSNNDGVTNATQDEFVEIVNASTNPIEMAGFMIFDGFGLRHIFSSATVPTGGAIVVFGGGSILNFGNPPAQLASTGALGLNNTGPESIILYSPATQILDRIDYTVTQPAAASETRYPDITGDFSNHFEVSLGLLRASPGRRADGSVFLTNQPPVLQSIGNQAVVLSNDLVFAVTAQESDGDPVTLVASNVPAGAAFGATNGVGLFTWNSASPVGTNTVTFHAWDKDGFDSETIDITVIPSPGGSENTNCGLIISEYVEGSSNNKALELYNGSGVTIDFDAGGYVIMGYNNGNTFATATYTWVLSGTIAPEATHVVGSSSAGSTLLALMQQSFGGANWNGDDAIVLRSGGTNGPIIDSIGQVGFDPGTAWTNSINTFNALNHTLRRLSTVAGGDTNASDAYVLDEWESFDQDTFDGIGTHSNVCSGASGGNDDDGDGMPNDWESLYFAGATNADAYTDSDTDGFFNIEEFVAFTDPTDSNSYFRVADITTGVDRAISVDSVTGRIYTLRLLTNLVTDAPGALQAGSVTGTGSRVELTDPSTDTGLSYRVGVEMQ